MVIFLFKCTMFMPQHPVYMKLGINKYCIKNQHLGLNALHLFCIFNVWIFFSPGWFLFLFFFAPRLPSSVCTSHGSNLKSVTLILFHLTTVSVLIIKKLLKSPFAFIYLFSIVLLSRAVRLVVPFLSPPTIKMWSISHLFPTLAVSIYNDIMINLHSHPMCSKHQ